MLKSKKKIGNFGENLAAQFLKAKGYRILDSHFCIQGGEIDIICEDMFANEIVFVEVKTRLSKSFGELTETISRTKMEKLFYTSEIYLKSHNQEYKNFRIDFVGVDLASFPVNIEHIEDIA